VLLGDARVHREKWRCPFSEHAGGELADECKTTLERVERVTGCERGSLTKCPGAYLRDPDVILVGDLHSWWMRGQLAMRDPHPSAARVEAITLLHGSIEAAKADALRRIREEHEREKERR